MNKETRGTACRIGCVSIAILMIPTIYMATQFLIALNDFKVTVYYKN